MKRSILDQPRHMNHGTAPLETSCDQIPATLMKVEWNSAASGLSVESMVVDGRNAISVPLSGRLPLPYVVPLCGERGGPGGVAAGRDCQASGNLLGMESVYTGDIYTYTLLRTVCKIPN